MVLSHLDRNLQATQRHRRPPTPHRSQSAGPRAGGRLRRLPLLVGRAAGLARAGQPGHCGIRRRRGWFYFSDIYSDEPRRWDSSASACSSSPAAGRSRRCAAAFWRAWLPRTSPPQAATAAQSREARNEDRPLHALRRLASRCSSSSWRWSPPSPPSISTSAGRCPRVWTRAAATIRDCPCAAAT